MAVPAGALTREQINQIAKAGMAYVREQNERRSSDCSGARVNDRTANVGSFFEQRREEPKSFDKWGNSRISWL